MVRMKNLFYILTFSLFISCHSQRIKDIRQTVLDWQGKEIQIPKYESCSANRYFRPTEIAEMAEIGGLVEIATKKLSFISSISAGQIILIKVFRFFRKFRVRKD